MNKNYFGVLAIRRQRHNKAKLHALFRPYRIK